MPASRLGPPRPRRGQPSTRPIEASLGRGVVGMHYEELIRSLQNVGKDPTYLIFEDELTGVYNRRFLFHYLEHMVPWQAIGEHPLSLLMMDLDNFKQVNDVHGHLNGDQALIHIATLFKEVAGETGFAIRYAGDEFIVLLPETVKRTALQLGEHLLERCRAEPLLLEQGPTVLPLTLSMGVASAPEDAQSGRSLIQKADTALYYAKHTGRNRLANAGEVGHEDVPQKAALQNVSTTHIVGRRDQLAQVTEYYQQFSLGQSQFLIVEGAAGMGRTTFLQVIRQAAPNKEFHLVHVNGARQEAFRPYYLATKILIVILSQQSDKVSAVLDDLSPDELAYLAHVLPQLERLQGVQPEKDDATLQAGIFSTLLTFIPKLVECAPLIVLIDDLQFADAATLFLLRQLLLRQDVPLFVCGTFLGSLSSIDLSESTPFERVYLTYHQELDIKKITLSPLTGGDIGDYLRGIFPNVSLTEEFIQNLAGVSQGSPLMLGEILRKLIRDQKITLKGQQWVIQPLEEGYLPKSLEEIVIQKISILDEESRQLLAQASVFGEDVSLSVLTGSSEQREAKVQEFLEQAVDLGLLSSEFHGNDEMIRFLGKRILDITYGEIEEGQRQALHERVGNYQERLYQQGVGPSAAYLAYHFKRSANQEKARKYEQLQAAYSTKVFDSISTASCTGNPFDEDVPDVPLDPDAWSQIPALLRSLLTAVRNLQLYPPESQAVANSTLQWMQYINQALARNERLKVVRDGQALFVNGQEFDVGEGRATAEKLLDLLKGVELQAIAFQRGLTEHEAKVFLSAFVQIKPAETLNQRFWQRFSLKRGLRNIQLKQVQYQEQGGDTEEPSQTALGPAKLDKQTLGDIQEAIRYLLSTTTNIKLYPLKSQTITGSMTQLRGALERLLEKQPSLTFARAEESLLVNGEKIDTSEFKQAADGFLDLLKSIGLQSLTWLEHFSSEELEAFMVAVREFPVGEGAKFWKGLTVDQSISRILFNEYLYGIRPELLGDEPTQGDAEADKAEEQKQEEPFDVFIKKLPERVNDHFLRGKKEPVRQMIDRMFLGFRTREPVIKKNILDACRRVLDTLPVGSHQAWTKLIAEPLLGVCAEEKDPKLVGVMGGLLRGMAAQLLSFAEYVTATFIFSQLLAQYREREKTKNPAAQSLAKVFETPLEPMMRNLLVDDLKSSDQDRQSAAAQLLGSLGPVAMPLLIEVIKKEEALRVRQIAALLLAELGPKAGKSLKQELVLEVTAQGRQRILEVIDTVTRSLEAELAFALGDQNRLVRKAAFQLAERLDHEEVGPLLMNYATSAEAGIATGAIKCLGKLKPAGATERLTTLLNSTKDTERGVACCQALGQIGDPNSIETLARVMAQKGWFFVGRRWNAQVRAAATFALRKIHPVKVAEVLRRLLNDPDPRVRQLAKTFGKASSQPRRSMKDRRAEPEE